ncbi:DUF3016 domain-containing protein [Massilia arenosa]|uniref:DUF3016 domain-containing protein n=1 Tax=Zemynaea arenosa TaxID=2561931 RepID=A0A4Y9SE06_9BURK|nr:DUF3016 domain-containing protein [Massilia arenosa]TFW20780.1 DUF3016 domain-containing protein [Massilia arenosa]
MTPTRISLALAGLFSLAAAAPARAGEAVITYVHPETFFDLPFATWERQDMLKNVADHFITEARLLPQGQELKVEVLDFDPAGRLHPSFRGGSEIRVVTGRADWPRMTVRYTLTGNGQVLASGEDQLSNMNYQMRINRYWDSDPLRYEKQMIDDWFKQRFNIASR